MNFKKAIQSFIFIVILFSSNLFAQDSDELFKQARSAAFDQKNYLAAIDLSKKALQKSPDYADIKIFLGRVYTWTGKLDSARTQFEQVLKNSPGHEDASLAYASLEYWNDNPTRAISILDSSLSRHANSEKLLLLKGKVLNSIRSYSDANEVVENVLRINPKNSEARILASRIKDNSTQNKIGIGYDFAWFDEQFNDPWHIVGIDYSRQTRLGSIAGRINYANRFNTGGLQFEADAYPSLTKNIYAYVNVGYSEDNVVFPKYRAGFSLYASLPAAFEAEAGFRLLHFDSNTWIYTLSAGKYVGNYWLNFRTYLTPSSQSISQSYSINVRYYFGGADDYLSVGAGTGISPDDNARDVLLSTKTYKLKSSNLSIGYRRSFKTFNVITLNASWANQEFLRSLETKKGKQINAGIGFIRRF